MSTARAACDRSEGAGVSAIRVRETACQNVARFFKSTPAIGRAARGWCRNSSGLQIANEVFADRTYQADGTLSPRSRPNAMILDVGTALGQVERMLSEGKVRAADRTDVAIEPDTVCIHGDQPGAAEFARGLRGLLSRLGVAVRAPGKTD